MGKFNSMVAGLTQPVIMTYRAEPTHDHPSGKVYSVRTAPDGMLAKAFMRYEQMTKVLSVDNPLLFYCIMTVIETAPVDRQAELLRLAIKENLIPVPTGYTESGMPVYRMADLGTRAGMSDEEAQQTLEEILRVRVEDGLGEGFLTDGSNMMLVQ